MTTDVMGWIAAVFPILSFLLGMADNYWIGRVWPSSILVFAGGFAAIWLWFSLSFWPWLLLYVFLCWLGCWAGHVLRARVRGTNQASPQHS